MEGDFIMKNKQTIYVASPYGGKSENLETHKEILNALIRTNAKSGKVFVSGIVSYGQLYDELTYIEGMIQCLGLLDCCDALLLTPGWEESKGCLCEWAYAKAKGITILTLQDWREHWLIEHATKTN